MFLHILFICTFTKNWYKAKQTVKCIARTQKVIICKEIFFAVGLMENNMVSGICFTNEREWDAKYLNTEFQRSPNF